MPTIAETEIILGYWEDMFHESMRIKDDFSSVMISGTILALQEYLKLKKLEEI